MTSSPLLPIDDLERLCDRAVRGSGGSPEVARVLAAATVAAERRGRPAVGAAHLLDYLDALRAGRLNGDPRPSVARTRSAIVTADADEGPAQLAFEMLLPELAEAAIDCGVAVASVRGAYAAGELGDYAVRLAERGFVSLACANSSPLMALSGARSAVAGTNPLAFGLPLPSGPRAFDQAASATAWVRVRDAARRGAQIPEGWALDADGEQTTDAGAALAGALLPFGGPKGSNIAVMIEMLAALSGGSFSLDAPPFDRGEESPRLGLFLIAVDPGALDDDYPRRAEEHLVRLETEHGVRFARRREPVAEVRLDPRVHAALVDAARRAEEER